MAMSPHYFNTRRNMQNYGLAVLPDVKIRFRLGYSPNTNVGPSYATLLMALISSYFRIYRRE